MSKEKGIEDAMGVRVRVLEIESVQASGWLPRVEEAMGVPVLTLSLGFDQIQPPPSNVPEVFERLKSFDLLREQDPSRA